MAIARCVIYEVLTIAPQQQVRAKFEITIESRKSYTFVVNLFCLYYNILSLP